MRKEKIQVREVIKYWLAADERIDWVLLGWVSVCLGGYQNFRPDERRLRQLGSLS